MMTMRARCVSASVPRAGSVCLLGRPAVRCLPHAARGLASAAADTKKKPALINKSLEDGVLTLTEFLGVVTSEFLGVVSSGSAARMTAAP